MGNWLKGILILALLAIFASFVWPFNANKRSAEMGTTIQNALSANGFDFATVNMSGNVARLSGSAPNEGAATAATDLAANTKCKKCASKKTWHKVVSDLDYNKVATASPYIFNAVKSEDGSIVLDGYVRNEAEKARVLLEAEDLFPNMVSNRTIKIAAGEPNANWGDVISLNLSEVAQLQRGRFNIENNQVFISGVAADENIRTNVASAMTDLPDGYKGETTITVPEAEVVETKPTSTCQTLLDGLKGQNKVAFETNKAGIKGEGSFDLLNTLGAAVKADECKSFSVQVIGHTDSDGPAEYNVGLSERRAASVVAYLIQEQNLDISRITAEGKGETSPIADNATRDGKAKNRRIEFLVTPTQ